MELKPINLENLKKLQGEERAKVILEYEEEKLLLIEEYMRLQDIVDQYNDEIYKITCHVEQINKILQEMRQTIPEKPVRLR